MEHREQPLITGVTHSTSEARVTLLGLRHEPGVAAGIFEALTEANVNVDMIDQNVPGSAGGKAEISFTVPHDDLRVATLALAALKDTVFEQMETQPEMGKVSIVGAGMRTHPGVAAKVFRVLADEGINIDMISTSPVRISCVIGRAQVKQAVSVLHHAFELGTDAVSAEEPFGAGGL